MTEARHVLKLLHALDRTRSTTSEDGSGETAISSSTMLEALIASDFDLSSAIVDTYRGA